MTDSLETKEFMTDSLETKKFMTDSLETKKFMTDSLEAKKLLIIRILQILEYYSDVNHPLTQEEIIKKLYDNYGIEAERKAIGRNIALLQDMFDRESMNKTATAIVIESDKRKGTFLDKRLFEDSELRLLIDGKKDLPFWLSQVSEAS